MLHYSTPNCSSNEVSWNDFYAILEFTFIYCNYKFIADKNNQWQNYLQFILLLPVLIESDDITVHKGIAIYSLYFVQC